MVNVMIVEDQKLVRSILESYIKKEEGYELLSSIPGADRAADRTASTSARANGSTSKTEEESSG